MKRAAASVSDVSGRGVGLDVVKAAVEGLSGTLAIESQPGRGARFRMALPLSVALIKVLLVEVDREIVALPMGRVIAAVELAEGAAHALLGDLHASPPAQ